MACVNVSKREGEFLSEWDEVERNNLIQDGKLDQTEFGELNKNMPADSCIVLYNRGRAYYNERAYDQAVSCFSQAIYANPDFFQAWNMRGLSLALLEKYPEAIKDYDQAILLNPNYVKALNNRGWAYYKQRNYQLALQDLNEAVSLAPNAPRPLIARAYTYLKMNQPGPALNDMNLVLEQLPNFASGLNFVAWIMAISSEDDLRNGARAYEKALQACELTNWKKWQFIGTLAAAAAEKGDFGLAVEHQTHALRFVMTDQDRMNCEARLQLYHQGKAYHPRCLSL
jgi:tetratricopeptide (TPR) repeat protein